MIVHTVWKQLSSHVRRPREASDCEDQGSINIPALFVSVSQALRASVMHYSIVIIRRAFVEANLLYNVLNRWWKVQSIGDKCEDDPCSDTEVVITPFTKTVKKTDE